jgi:iron-sulfur cluster insertion protein
MITMTPTAEQKIRELLVEEKDTIGLRVFVKGGGCHGYQYGMAFESQLGEDDTVIEKGEVKVIMDSQSAPLLAGCEVDYQDTVQGSGFAIKPRVGAAVHSAHDSMVRRKLREVDRWKLCQSSERKIEKARSSPTHAS